MSVLDFSHGHPVLIDPDQFTDQNILVLNWGADVYVNGLLQSIQDSANLFYVEDEAAFFESLSNEKWHIVIAPDSHSLRSDIDNRQIQGVEFLFYSLFFGESDNGLTYNTTIDLGSGDAVKKALGRHKSQLPSPSNPHRIPWDEYAIQSGEIYAKFAKSHGFDIDEDYANLFYVFRINGEGKEEHHEGEEIKPLMIPEGGAVAILAPHPDDAELGAGFFMRKLVESKINIRLLLHSSGKNGLSKDDDIVAKALRSAKNEVSVLETYRSNEALAAAKELAKGCRAKIHIDSLQLDLLEKEKRNEVILAGLRDFLEDHNKNSHGEPTFLLPHPIDRHPTHSEMTQRDLQVIKNLAREYQQSFQVLYYFTPWTGRENTFFLYQNDEPPNLYEEYKELRRILLPELLSSQFGSFQDVSRQSGNRLESFRRESI